MYILIYCIRKCLQVFTIFLYHLLNLDLSTCYIPAIENICLCNVFLNSWNPINMWRIMNTCSCFMSVNLSFYFNPGLANNMTTNKQTGKTNKLHHIFNLQSEPLVWKQPSEQTTTDIKKNMLNFRWPSGQTV